MPVTDKDLEKKRERIAKLREQVANEEAKAAENVLEQSREIEIAQLDVEEARLQAQLSAAKEVAKRSNVTSGSVDLTANLEAAKEAAKSVTPPGVTVDPNEGSGSNNSSDTKSDGDEKKG